MIPAYITCFNTVDWAIDTAVQCQRLGLRPVIMDQCSTYPPAVVKLDSIDNIEVHRLGVNLGCHGFFLRGDHTRQSGPYVVTDCDLDLSGIPDDVMDRLANALVDNVWATKVGLSLEVDDLPDYYHYKAEVRDHESRWWQERLPDGNWRAQIDTTFALYDPTRNIDDFYTAVRLDRPYTAKHRPWYLDLDNLPPDVAAYTKGAQNAHWTRLHRLYLGKSA